MKIVEVCVYDVVQVKLVLVCLYDVVKNTLNTHFVYFEIILGGVQQQFSGHTIGVHAFCAHIHSLCVFRSAPKIGERDRSFWQWKE